MSGNRSWDEKDIKIVKAWFECFFDGLNRLDEQTQAKALENCGRVCALDAANSRFKKAWANKKDFDHFFELLNHEFGAELFAKTADNQVAITYPRCFCPLVHLGLVQSPALCHCSTFWIKENFESVLGQKVKIVINHTVLRKGKNCSFTMTF
jgi:hypothetical protein